MYPAANAIRRALAGWAMLAATTAGPAPAGEPVDIAFYACHPCASRPVIDGRLDDPCWSDLPRMEDFFKYWRPRPEPPPLRTCARFCYDADGLYVGIVLYDEQVDRIRATIRDRDNPLTWTDDCVEIMIDPDNSATGYVKFVTNFFAARYDERMTNMVMDSSWNVEGWTIATGKAADHWTIEGFIGWNAIGSRPAEGDVWSFDLVRYGYSTGRFRGVTWSLGGSGASPQHFGYLGFGRFAPMDPASLARIAQVARRTKGERFRLVRPDGVWTHRPGGRWTHEALGPWVVAVLDEAEQALREGEEATAAVPAASERARLEGLLKELRGHLQTERARLEPAAGLGPASAAAVREAGRRIGRQARELTWEARLTHLVTSY